ncbi:hypothetical protein, partial [Kitasatospora nipponensis]|uniref:hypothetical protein n=1 Tax=Kitasatospora nipponensis TaxID=258049 RepID=UPI0031E17C74
DPAARAAANGVTVSVTLVAATDGGSAIRATFTPDMPGFHLYSVDLPDGGVDGLGIPTRLSVRGDLTATGSPTAGVSTRLLRPAGLTVDLPVYPDGAVTLTLPVRRTGSHQADVIVSYGACSENRCLVPVRGQALHLALD